MLQLIMKHNDNNGELNDNEAFLNELNDLRSVTREEVKEEYYNSLIVNYYSNDSLQYVYFTVCREDKVDGYILKVVGASIEEIAEHIAEKRISKKEFILEYLV